MMKKAKVYMLNNGKKEHEFSEIEKKVLSLASKHELKAARETSILPGVFEALRTLKKMNLKLGIFTINSQKSTAYIIREFRLKQFFSTIVTRENVSQVKPDPSHLAITLRALDVDAEEALVVGDSVVDIGSAKALDVASIGVAKSNDEAHKLKSAGAMHVIQSITDLPTYLGSIKEDKHQALD
jgi:HAD superfamily hydrolase (TIGR01549 family)